MLPCRPSRRYIAFLLIGLPLLLASVSCSAQSAATGEASSAKSGEPTATSAPIPTVEMTATAEATPTVEPSPTVSSAEQVATATVPVRNEPLAPAAGVTPQAGEPGGGNARTAALRQSLQSVIDGLNGQWGIGVQDLSNGDTVLINAERPYEAASLYKVLVLYEAYRRIEDGTLKLDQMTTMTEADYADSLAWDEELKVGDRVSVKGLVRVMTIQSSNAAAHALERMMGVSTFNQAAQELGMSQTHMPVAGDSARYDDWRAQSQATSVPDLMRFFGMLYRGEVVSKTASKAMMDLLKEQQINDRIPALLPSGVEVAHKTGNLPGVVADAGIIFGTHRDVIMVVLSDGADHDQGTAAIGKMAQLVYAWQER